MEAACYRDLEEVEIELEEQEMRHPRVEELAVVEESSLAKEVGSR
jgi:hypothetical protein